MNKFFEYVQNNSGGGFDFDENVTIYVIVEAANAEESDERFETLGGYFDGCDVGMDCPCCGDRWYRVYEEDGTNVPSHYGKPIDEYKEDNLTKRLSWAGDNPDYIIHYIDGTKKSGKLK